MAKAKAKSLFDHIKNLREVQNPKYFDELDDASKKSFSIYNVHKYLSMDVDYIYFVSELQPYTESLNGKLLYLVYIGILPKGKKYIKYIKASSDGQKYDDWLIELIAKEFECSIKQATEYLQILYNTKEGKHEIKDICDRYGIEPKQISKLKLKL